MDARIKTDKSEVLRYLGYRGQVMSAELEQIVDDTISETESVAKPLSRLAVFDIKPVSNGVEVCNTSLVLEGEGIKRHLDGCDKAALFAATIGIDVEKKTREYEVSDITRAVIMDCCGSALIESVCDNIQRDFETHVKCDGLFITDRFSPGYGDLPLEIQPEILRVLDTARKIGLTCNKNNLMFPRKSVTAIIGVSKTERPSAFSRCNSCNLKDKCKFRKDGETCGYKK